jgi:serine/threonine-protein kinase SRPK3
MNYFQKYIKYKSKYLNELNKIYGGSESTDKKGDNEDEGEVDERDEGEGDEEGEEGDEDEGKEDESDESNESNESKEDESEEDESDEDESDEDESDEDESDEDESDKESAIGHQENGKHFFSPGEVINKKYRVIKQLGAGHFSTVWEVHDITKKEGDLNFNVALKVLRSGRDHMADYEIEILEKIGDLEKNTMTLLDKFTINLDGQCTHKCLVFPILGNSLLTWLKRYNFKGLPIQMVKKIAFDVLTSINYIHQQGIIHTDLKPENILLSKQTTLSNEGFVKPDSSFMKRDEKNRLLLYDVDERNRIMECTPLAFVTDFGNACDNTDRCVPITTTEYRSPEAILEDINFTTATDMFSIGCIFFELLTGDYLFDVNGERDSESKNEKHLLMIFELMGQVGSLSSIQLPVSIQSEKIDDYFKKDRTVNFTNTLDIWGLQNILERKYKFDPIDALMIADFLNPMLQVDPVLRISAEDALKDPWLCEYSGGESCSAAAAAPSYLPKSETASASNHPSQLETASASAHPPQLETASASAHPAKLELTTVLVATAEPIKATTSAHSDLKGGNKLFKTYRSRNIKINRNRKRANSLYKYINILNRYKQTTLKNI